MTRMISMPCRDRSRANIRKEHKTSGANVETMHSTYQMHTDLQKTFPTWDLHYA